MSLLKLEGSPPAPSTAPSDTTPTGSTRPSSRSGLAFPGSAGASSSLVSLDAGTAPLPASSVVRPSTPRSAGASLEALKKFDAGGSGSGGMVPLAAEAALPASVPIGLGLHMLRPMSSSRGLASRPPSAGLAGGMAHAARPVTPRGPLTALVAQQSTAAANAAIGSISSIQVSMHRALLEHSVHLKLHMLTRSCSGSSRPSRSLPVSLRPLQAVSCSGCSEHQPHIGDCGGRYSSSAQLYHAPQ